MKITLILFFCEYFGIYFSYFYDLRYVKISLNGLKTFANQIWFVTFDAMYLALVLLRVDSNCTNIELCACSENSNGDFT